MVQPANNHVEVHVLLVEPSPAVTDHLRQVLHTYCPEVKMLLQASGIATALAQVQVTRIDIVIASTVLDDGTGELLCRALRDQPLTANIGIVLIGTHTSSRDKIAGLASGADDFIVQPIDDRLLVSRLRLLWRLKGK
jgi:DNA-binding response OmpR family regulator